MPVCAVAEGELRSAEQVRQKESGAVGNNALYRCQASPAALLKAVAGVLPAPLNFGVGSPSRTSIIFLPTGERARVSGESARLLLDVVDLLVTQKVDYAVIGVLAACIHGAVRASIDAIGRSGLVDSDKRACRRDTA